MGAPGSADNKPGSAWERLRQAWELLESQYSSLWKTSSSLETLLVRLEIIAPTYHSTIFGTHVCSVYSHLCIYIATHLHTVYLGWLQAVRECNSRCAWKWRPSELRDTLQSHDRTSLEMHLEAVNNCRWRFTWRLWSSKFGDMHLEAIIEQVWRCTLRPWLCELAGCNRAILEILLESVIECVCRFALGVLNRVSWEIHLEAVIQQDWTSTWVRGVLPL